MSKCGGIHCPDCSGSGSGSGLLEAGAVVLAGAVALSIVTTAVDAALDWLAVAWPYLAAGGSLALAGGTWLAVLVSRRRARVAVSWQLGRTGLPGPQRPAGRAPAVIPGVVIQSRPAGIGARRAARLSRGRQELPAWPRTRPDGSREAR
jgi:hypothetical protein